MRGQAVIIGIVVLSAVLAFPLDELVKPLAFLLVLSCALAVILGATALAERLFMYGLQLFLAVAVWDGLAAAAARVLAAMGQKLTEVSGRDAAPGSGGGGGSLWLIALVALGVAYVVGLGVRRRVRDGVQAALKGGREAKPTKPRSRRRADQHQEPTLPELPDPELMTVDLFEPRDGYDR
jgi:hypothetical protein